MTSIGSVIYRKGQQSDSEDMEEVDDQDSNEWDDTILNKAYDKAVKYAKLEVARRIAESTNNLESPLRKLDTPGKPSKFDTEAKKANQGKKSKKRDNGDHPKWKVGNKCRAIYADDGLEYEAEIIKLINDDLATVRFFGYDNEEVVSILSLKESYGPQAIIQQNRKAQISDICESGPNAHQFNGETSSNKRVKNKRRKAHGGVSDMLGMGNIPPPFCVPPPGIPFGLNGIGSTGFMGLGGLNGHNSSNDTDSNGALTAMLVSWYLSGYYTGYYQGVNEKDKNKHKSRKE